MQSLVMLPTTCRFGGVSQTKPTGGRSQHFVLAYSPPDKTDWHIHSPISSTYAHSLQIHEYAWLCLCFCLSRCPALVRKRSASALPVPFTYAWDFEFSVCACVTIVCVCVCSAFHFRNHCAFEERLFSSDNSTLHRTGSSISDHLYLSHTERS